MNNTVFLLSLELDSCFGDVEQELVADGPRPDDDLDGCSGFS